MRRLLLLALCLVAAPAWAQRTEIGVRAGYTTAGEIESRAPTIDELELEDGFAWGLQGGHFFTEHLGVEAAWVRHESGVGLVQAGGDRAELFDVNVDQLLGALAYRFGDEDGRLRPFVFAGLGATFFGARDLEGETKFSWTAGAGLTWSAWRRIGARLEARYNPTYLNDSEAEFCDPFGFCQTWLHQFQFTAGLVVAF